MKNLLFIITYKVSYIIKKVIKVNNLIWYFYKKIDLNIQLR